MSELFLTPAQVESWIHTRLPHAKRQGKEYRDKCPIHHGERLSFAVNAETGRAFCHSACGRGWDLIGLEQELTGADFTGALASVEAIVGSVNGNGHHKHGEFECAYDYTDEQGKLLYQVVRYRNPKNFSQRRPDGRGGWIANMKGISPVPYHLPEVVKAGDVFVVEGERDVETVRKLGYCATCNSGGAGKWRKRSFSQYLAGKHVTIIPDADEPGRKHAADVANSALDAEASVKILELPHGKDATDWVAAGGTAEELALLAENSPTLTREGLSELRARWFPSVPPPPAEGHIEARAEVPQEGAPRIRCIEDIPSVLSVATAEVSWTVTGWLVKGSVNVLTSEPGDGKTTVGLASGGAVSIGAKFGDMPTTKQPVLVLDRENTVAFIADVLKRLRIKDGGGLRIWGGWCPEQAPEPASPIVLAWVSSCEPKPLIIIDSLVAFHGGNENDATETRAYMQQCRRLADMGATVLLLHHSGKGESSQDYRGSSDIKASADACFKLSNIGPTNCIERLRIKPFKSRFLVEPEIVLSYRDGIFTREVSGGQRATDAELLRDLLREHPGITVVEFEKLAPTRNVSRSYARAWLSRQVEAETVTVTRGAKNAKLHTWGGNPDSEGVDDLPF